MKPIKDTKLGAWLKKNAPKALEIAGDLLPDKGALGILKNLIDRSPEVPPEQKLEFDKLQQEFEIELLKDTQNARQREVDIAKATGKLDYFQRFIGVCVNIAFFACMAVTIWVKLDQDQREMFIEVRSYTVAAWITVVGYYFGSSAGSRIQQMLKSVGK